MQILTYVVFRTLLMVVAMLSPRLGRRMGRLIGRVLYAVDAKHRKIAHKNLTRTEGWPKEPRQQALFIRRCYEHFGTGLVENLMLPKLVQGRRLTSMTRLERLDICDRLLSEGRGIIVVIAHLGNWEWAGLAVTMAGYPLNSLARPMENPYLNGYLNRFRTLTGQRIIPNNRARVAMIDVLKRNEILVLLADQDASYEGLYLPFFGQHASTVKSPAILSLRYGAPIVPVNIWRDEEGIHHVRLSEPLHVHPHLAREEATEALLRAMNRRFEEFIREHPTQWLWMHGRWQTAGRILREFAEHSAETERLTREPTSAPSPPHPDSL